MTVAASKETKDPGSHRKAECLPVCGPTPVRGAAQTEYFFAHPCNDGGRARRHCKGKRSACEQKNIPFAPSAPPPFDANIQRQSRRSMFKGVTMGLDMYVYARYATMHDGEVVDFSEMVGDSQIRSWRKHHAMHSWMERLYRSKGGQSREFYFSTVLLTADDIDALEKAVSGGEIRHTHSNAAIMSLPNNVKSGQPVIADRTGMPCVSAASNLTNRN